jgi:hypothetical protein
MHMVLDEPGAERFTNSCKPVVKSIHGRFAADRLKQTRELSESFIVLLLERVDLGLSAEPNLAFRAPSA